MSLHDDAVKALDLMAKGVDPGQLTQPVSPRGTFLDQFNTQENPTANDLIREYKETVYACAILNAQAVASTPLRLYVTTDPGQPKVRFWEKRAVSAQTRNHLKAVPSLTARIGSDTELEEVIDHPLIMLLDSVNNLLDAFTLWELVDLYQEILGSAYLYVPRGRLGVPENIWVLPAQGVSVKRDKKKIIQRYVYRQGQEELDIKPEEVIPFHFPNLRDPYLDGWSPVRATYETLNISGKSRSYRQAMLDNRVRPDAIMAPKEPIGGPEAVRLEKEINQKYRRGGIGGIMVVDENYTVQPLTLPLKDLEALSSEQISKETLANAFGVPMSLLSSTNVNRANAEAGHYQHAKLAVYPRCLRIQYRLNQRLVPLYDQRLFLAFDNPVPEDTKIQVLVSKTDAATGDTTINERRSQRGLKPVEWGDYPSWEAFKADTAPEPDPQEGEESTDDPETDDSNVKGMRVLFDYAEGTTVRFEAETRLRALGYSEKWIKWALEPAELPGPDLCCHDKNPEVHDPEWYREKQSAHSRRLPTGRDLEDRLKNFFRWQRGQVLSRIKSMFDSRAKLSLDPLDLSSFTEEMRSRVAPLIEMAYDQYGKEALSRVGATDMVDTWNVSLPEVRDAINNQTLEFCRATQRTTTLQLNKAIEEVKEQLRLGILSGRNTPAELTRRVNGVFKHAEKYRSQRIALTESSRAVHRGQMLAAQKSGRVKSFRWLLSPDACEICQDIYANQREVSLGSNFAIRGTGTYSEIKHPPAHPNCMCTVTEVLHDKLPEPESVVPEEPAGFSAGTASKAVVNQLKGFMDDLQSKYDEAAKVRERLIQESQELYKKVDELRDQARKLDENDPLLQELKEKIKIAREERNKIGDRIVQQLDVMSDSKLEMKARTKEIILKQRPGKNKILWKGKGQVKKSKKWEEAQEWLNDFLGKTDRDVPNIDCYFRKGSGGRASYRYGGSETGMHVGSRRGVATMIHEYGHHLEHTDSELHRAAKAFLQKRAGSEARTPLSRATGISRYHSDEFCKIDKFIDPYMGKLYSDATELISMGIELMYKDPSKLYVEDPEMFEWILRVVWESMERLGP